MTDETKRKEMMSKHYIERKLNITLTDRDEEALLSFDPDIIKYCVDRAAIRPDVTNKLPFVLSIARGCRKETNALGTFIVNGLIRTKIDSNQQQLSLEDEDSLPYESSYQAQPHSYSRAIMLSSSHESKLTPKERDEKFQRAKQNYAAYQEAARLYKEKIEMKPVQTKPFELKRNPEYVDRGEPKSSIQRCIERLNL